MFIHFSALCDRLLDAWTIQTVHHLLGNIHNCVSFRAGTLSGIAASAGLSATEIIH